MVVADTTQIRKTLAWQPRFDDLTTIVRDALAWERKLAARRDTQGSPRAAVERV
jgi:UDP-glucose 4-epimerase